jgi:hypothetical protein
MDDGLSRQNRIDRNSFEQLIPVSTCHDSESEENHPPSQNSSKWNKSFGELIDEALVAS